MDDLIERLERASEGSRELDALLAVATFKTIKTDDDLIYAVPVRCYGECAPGTYWYVCRSGRSLRTAPNFTTSLDAALSLVPEGWEWEISTLYGIARAGIGLNLDSGIGYGEHKGGLPTLALCSAALRARATAKVSEAAPALTAAISSWKMET